MTFFEHLAELRKRIINSLYAIGIGAFIGVYISPKSSVSLSNPMLKALQQRASESKLVYNHPAGASEPGHHPGRVYRIVLASPWSSTRFGFSWPPLFISTSAAPSPVSFSPPFSFSVAGIAFGYFVTLPYMLRFLVSFQGPGSSIKPMITVNEYFDLVLMVLLGLGLVFELPILIFFLFALRDRHAEVSLEELSLCHSVISIVAAIITPTPDAMTMLIFMAPMIGLYFVGIAVSAVVTRRRERRLATRRRGCGNEFQARKIAFPDRARAPFCAFSCLPAASRKAPKPAPPRS